MEANLPLSDEPSCLRGMLVELAFQPTLWGRRGLLFASFTVSFFSLCFLNPWVFNLTDFHPVG